MVYRYGAGNTDLTRGYSSELVGLAPDAILAISGFALGALLPAARTVPIVLRARLIELDPKYVDVIVHRGQDQTGQGAKLEASGESFGKMVQRKE
jgi:hypothetical protein